MTTQGRALFLPEVVGLDDAGRVDLRGKVLLEDLKDGLDGRPGRAPHVQHGRETALPRLIAGTERILSRLMTNATSQDYKQHPNTHKLHGIYL